MASSFRIWNSSTGIPRVPDCDSAGTAERSYPKSKIGGMAKSRYLASKVRGGDERSYPASEVRGGSLEEIPYAPSPRPGVAGGRTNPTSKEPWLHGCRRA